MRMTLRQYIDEGDRLPTLYRVAWYDVFRRKVVAFPLGINLLAKWIRFLWMLSYKWTPSSWDLELRRAYINGRDHANDKCNILYEDMEKLRQENESLWLLLREANRHLGADKAEMFERRTDEAVVRERSVEP